jgi:hypothetical protein
VATREAACISAIGAHTMCETFRNVYGEPKAQHTQDDIECMPVKYKDRKGCDHGIKGCVDDKGGLVDP